MQLALTVGVQGQTQCAVSQQMLCVPGVNVLHAWVTQTSSGIFQHQQSFGASVFYLFPKHAVLKAGSTWSELSVAMLLLIQRSSAFFPFL